MGLNAASVHVRVGKGARVRRTLADAIRRTLHGDGYEAARVARDADRTLILHPPGKRPWMTVFDSESIESDSFAAGLSRETGAEILSSSIQQSDVMRLALFRAGQAVDILASQGLRGVGRPELWLDLLTEDATPQLLRDALERPFIFAEDRLVAVAGLLGLNRELCLAHVDDLLAAPGPQTGSRLYFRRCRPAAA